MNGEGWRKGVKRVRRKGGRGWGMGKREVGGGRTGLEERSGEVGSCPTVMAGEQVGPAAPHVPKSPSQFPPLDPMASWNLLAPPLPSFSPHGELLWKPQGPTGAM